MGIIKEHQRVKNVSAQKFKRTPYLNISRTVNFLVEKAIVFGGVAAGRAKANEAETSFNKEK